MDCDGVSLGVKLVWTISIVIPSGDSNQGLQDNLKKPKVRKVDKSNRSNVVETLFKKNYLIKSTTSAITKLTSLIEHI